MAITYKEAFMHAPLFMPMLDPLMPAPDQVIAGRTSIGLRQPLVGEAEEEFGGNLISLAKLHERLSLLVQLELPCTITIPNPFLHWQETLIRKVELAGDSLTIAGNDFNLYLRGANIHSIRLVNNRETGGGIARLDIHHLPDMVYASIQPALEGTGGAVWRDVMDNPLLPLC